MINIDIMDPSVDPQELWRQFREYYGIIPKEFGNTINKNDASFAFIPMVAKFFFPNRDYYEYIVYIQSNVLFEAWVQIGYLELI